MLDAQILALCQRSIRPPSRMPLDEAVDGRRMLPRKAAAEPGPWRNSKTPYLVEIMRSLSPTDRSEVVVFQSGVQVGKTELGLNWEWYIPQYAPAPMMHLLPTEEIARRVVSQRFDPMVEESPDLAAYISEAKTGRGRGTRNRLMEKNFPGGVIFFAWAESPAMLRSMPARYLFVDEVDAMGASKEGDPIELARKRLATFEGRSKTLVVSTPTLKSTSRIHHWFLRGDQRRYFVPCPFCEYKQVLRWEQIRILERDSNNLPSEGSVRYECESCGSHIEESAKPDMLAGGEWRPTAQGEPGVKSYHLPGLCSPWMTWEKIAREYVSAVHLMRENRDPERLIVAMNTLLGEVYDDEADESASSALTPELLASRAEDRPPLVVPMGAHLITIGVDVQADRIEASVYAWGPHDECWLIYHEAMWGAPDEPGSWDGLDALLDRVYSSEDGRDRRVVSCAIDSGHRTQEVYDYVWRRQQRGDSRVIAVKGANREDAPPFTAGSRVEVDYRGRRVPDGVQLWIVGTHANKDVLRRRFAIDTPGPGYYHLMRAPNDHDGSATLEFCEQLLSEKKVLKRSGRAGGYRTEWVRVRPSQAAEAWDCLGYAYVAALRAGLRRIDWSRVLSAEAMRREPSGEPKTAPEPRNVAREPYPTPAPVRPPRRRVSRSRFVGG